MSSKQSKERTTGIRWLEASLERGFLKDIQSLRDEALYSDTDVLIEDEDFYLKHKCIVSALSPFLYEHLFLNGDTGINRLAQFPTEMPEIEKVALRNVYKNEQRDVKNHEVDLSVLLTTSLHSDVTFQVDGVTLDLHRCVLVSRCEYFNIMFNGSWVETERCVVPVKNISAAGFRSVLDFLYRPWSVVPKEAGVSELLYVADMYMIESLKEVVSFHLRSEFCHFLHPPCKGCIIQVVPTLGVCLAHNFTRLVEECHAWLNTYYHRVFVLRDFSTCKPDLRNAIVSHIKQSITVSNVLENLHKCSVVKETIPRVNWAKKITPLADDIERHCSQFLCDHFPKLVSLNAFADVCYNQNNVHWMHQMQEHILSALGNFTTVQNCLGVRKGVQMISDYAARIENNELDKECLKHWRDFAQKLADKLKKFVVVNFILICKTHKKQLSKETREEFSKLAGYM